MRVDVVFGGASLAPADVAGRVVAVIDVLRASTTIAVALSNGARAVIPLESSGRGRHAREGVRAQRRLPRRRAEDARDSRLRPRKFSAASSRARPSRERRCCMTTTNGTPAIANTPGRA